MPDAISTRFVDRVHASLSQPDADLDEELCTVVGWLAEHGDSASRFMGQLRRKGLRLSALDGALQGTEGRAAFPVQLLADRPLGVPLYLLVEASGPGAWALEAVTRSAAHARHFVSGDLPSLLRWSALPESSELVALGMILLDEARSAGGGDLARIDNAVRIELAQRLAAGHSIQVASTAVIAQLGRGAITFRVDTDDDEPADWTVYLLQRDDGGWDTVTAEWSARVRTLLDMERAE